MNIRSSFFCLMAEFGAADIPLRLIAQKYFGLSEKQASERARLQQLPIPTFRGGSQKSEWLVNISDLATFIDDKREKAKNDWNRINR